MGFARKLSLTFATQLSSQALTMITGLALVHIMAPDVKGAYDWLLQAPPLLMSLGNLGFATAITYLGSSRRYSLERLGGLGLLLGCVVGTLLALSSLPWLVPMARELHAPLPLLCIALGTVPALLVRSYINTTLLVGGRIARYNAVEIAIPIGFVFFMAAGCVVFGLTLESGSRWVWVGVGARFSAVIASVALALAFAAQLYRLRPRFDFEVLREGWSTARWAYGCSAVNELNARFGFVVLIPILLGWHLTEGQVKHALGLFGIALSFAEMLRSFSLAVEPVLFAEVAGDPERSRVLTPAVARCLGALCLCGALGVAAAAPLVIWMLNPEYLHALPALWILLPGVVGLAVAKTLYADLMGRGMVRWIFWNNAACFVAMSLAHILFVPWLGTLGMPWLGTMGMAIGMSVGYLLQTGCAISRYRRLTGVPLRDLLVPNRGDWERVRRRWRRPEGDA